MYLVIVTFYLKKWPCVVLKFALEVAFVNAATATADIAQMACFAGGEVIDRSLQVELMTLFYK